MDGECLDKCMMSCEELRERMLPASFYLRGADTVAVDLLGKVLVHETDAGVFAGVIVETEAYFACGDAGCHASRGRTPRNSVMFEPGGTAYVYHIHRHNLLNAVTGIRNFPEAVLLRALEPIIGVEIMQARRGRRRLQELTSGPGKLTQALGIGIESNRVPLYAPPLYIASPAIKCPRPITTTTRIGLAPGKGDQLPLRYYYSDSGCVSVKARCVRGR